MDGTAPNRLTNSQRACINGSRESSLAFRQKCQAQQRSIEHVCRLCSVCFNTFASELSFLASSPFHLLICAIRKSVETFSLVHKLYKLVSNSPALLLSLPGCLPNIAGYVGGDTDAFWLIVSTSGSLPALFVGETCTTDDSAGGESRS